MIDASAPAAPLRDGKRRVALFSGNYNYTRDGANRALNKLVAHLLERGFAVRVYSPTSKTPAFEGAGELVSVPSFAISGRTEFRVAFGLPRQIGEDVRRFNPDIIHVSAPDWLGTSAQFLAARMRVPLVASLHTRFETYFDFYGLGWLRQWAWRRQSKFYKRSGLVLAPNESMRAHLEEMGVDGSRVRIWGRGVDSAEFSPSFRSLKWRRSLGIGDHETVILFFGRLVVEKGIAEFIEAIRELEASQTPHRVLVVGKGPAEDKLRTSLPRAHFTGELLGEELGRAIASADILLNPSRTEAFGNVNLEAMASGVAIVSADDGSASSLIDHGRTGLLCKGNSLEFAACIRQLVINKVERNRLAEAAFHASKRYRWDDILDQVIDAYDELDADNSVRR